MARVQTVTLADSVRLVQFCYPQIYFACHTRHHRARSSDARVSQRDSVILVHIGAAGTTSLSPLARHLGLAPSTLSEALSRLSRLGYIEKAPRSGVDRRAMSVRLTPKGVAAVQDGSVLETARLQKMLSRVSAAERRVICRGLSRLADACRAGSRR
jgi:DNA-binding MarR family transcriptional regulator